MIPTLLRQFLWDIVMFYEFPLADTVFNNTFQILCYKLYLAASSLMKFFNVLDFGQTGTTSLSTKLWRERMSIKYHYKMEN